MNYIVKFRKQASCKSQVDMQYEIIIIGNLKYQYSKFKILIRN